jgi:hypothetical protein
MTSVATLWDMQMPKRIIDKISKQETRARRVGDEKEPRVANMSLNELHEFVLEFFEVEFKSSSRAKSYSIYNKSTRQRAVSEKRVCSHCGKENHTVDKCWKKHGNPRSASQPPAGTGNRDRSNDKNGEKKPNMPKYEKKDWETNPEMKKLYEDGKCFLCKQPGHRANQCPQLNQQKKAGDSRPRGGKEKYRNRKDTLREIAEAINAIAQLDSQEVPTPPVVHSSGSAPSPSAGAGIPP